MVERHNGKTVVYEECLQCKPIISPEGVSTQTIAGYRTAKQVQDVKILPFGGVWV